MSMHLSVKMFTSYLVILALVQNKNLSFTLLTSSSNEHTATYLAI